MKRVLAAALCMASLSACSTIVEGSDQAVAINTPGVDGALCDLNSPAIGLVSVRTPGQAMLTKSKHDIQVVCRKEGYSDGIATIPSNFEGMTLGNIIFGGIIGVGVDAASGAMNKYQPSLNVHMTKTAM